MNRLPRLLGFSLGLAIVCELLVLLPTLTAERHAWLQQQFLLAPPSPDTGAPAIASHINLDGETQAQALQATLRDLLWRTAEPLAVTGPAGPDTTRTLILNTRTLGDDLRHTLGPAALAALPFALTPALLALASLVRLLRQPRPPAAAPSAPPQTAAVLAKLSHDMRGILSPALLAAERLQANPDPKIRGAGDLIAEVVDRAIALVKQTLDAARPAAPRGPVLLSELLAGLPIENQAPRNFALIADAAALRRTLEQFALTATEAGASLITLSARITAEAATLTLTDNRRGQAQPGPAQELARPQGGRITLAESSFGSNIFRLTLPQPESPASPPRNSSA